MAAILTTRVWRVSESISNLFWCEQCNLHCHAKQARKESRKLRNAPNADCVIMNIVGQNGYCLYFPDYFLVGQKVNKNESVLKTSFQQQK